MYLYFLDELCPSPPPHLRDMMCPPSPARPPPPLDQLPKGQWLCPICKVMLHKGQTLFSHQTEVEKAKLSQMPQPTVRKEERKE